MTLNAGYMNTVVPQLVFIRKLFIATVHRMDWVCLDKSKGKWFL